MDFQFDIKFSQIRIAFFLATIALAMISATTFAQNNIEGVWKSEDENYMIKISSLGNEYQARIVWLKNEKDENGKIKLDVNNPDQKYRKIPIKGLKIVAGLQYNVAKNCWENGSLYIPNEGKYYSCRAKIAGNKLTLTYYKGSEDSSKTWVWFRQS